MPKQNYSAVITLALVVFIDTLGLAILFPILNPLFMSTTQGIMPLASPAVLRNFYYGFTLSIFPIAAFFAAPILGNLSDKLGRKRVLLVCLIGAFVSYFLAALAIVTKIVWLFLLSRIVAGLTAGSQPIAQAAIVDMSHSQHKARNLSLVIMTVSLGFIAGPLMGGFLTDTQLVSWFNLSTPLWFAAILALINSLLLMITIKSEQVSNITNNKLNLWQGMKELIMAFSNKHIQVLAIISLFFQLGWSSYFQFISLFLSEKIHFSANQIAVFLALIALGFAIASFVLPKMNRQFGEVTTTLISLTVAALSYLLTVLLPWNNTLWIVAMLVGISAGIAYTLLITLLSNLVSVNEQGLIMGISAAISSISWAVTSLMGGLLVTLSFALPLILAVMLLMLSAVCLYCFVMKRSITNINTVNSLC